jgi:ArsR family transcriptional regulator, arsenate/arsenite/antimonite-responsive transcriptional repressor
MDAKQIVAGLSALAHEHRLGLFRLLVQRGPEGLPAGVIAERLGIMPTSLSFHLQQLMHAGLISQRRLGRQLIYAANYQSMRGLIVYLTKNCCAESSTAAPGAAGKQRRRRAA